MSPYRCPPRRTRPAPARLRVRRPARYLLSLLAALVLALGTSALALLGPATPAYAAGDLTVRVYQDLDRDGEFDPGEAFVAPAGGGIPVAVYNADNTLEALNNTAAGGTVTFTALPSSAAGRPYRVEVVASAIGVVSRFGTTPPPNTLVSFVSVADGAAVSLDVGLRLNGNFGGVANRRTIVTRVWDDHDGNGIQDAGEPGIAGVTLRAVDTVSGDPIAGVPEVTTDAGGYAVFDDSIPTDTSLSLRVVGGAPAGYLLTRQDVNDNQFTPFDQRDSDAFLRGGSGPVEVVVPAALPGQNDDSIDIGFTQGAISGFVFRDRDAAKNGLFTAGVDEQLDGVEVQLFNLEDTLVLTQTTRTVGPGSAGFFEFGNLPLSGSPYRLVIPSGAFDDDADLLFGAASSPNPPGGDRGQVNGTTDSAVVGPTDDVQITGIDLTDVTPGTTNVSAGNLFGFYQGTIGDLVALDADRDGTVDPEDASLGIPEVLVFIDDGRAGGTAGNNLRETGELSATTDTGGRYRFDNVALGTDYSVVLDRSNFEPGGRLEGLGSTNALSVTLAPSGRALVRTSASLTVTLDTDLGVDFGIRGADVGNVVWDDADGDGQQDVGETGVQSVTVRIFRATDPPAQVGAAQVTDATGAYTIPNLLAGSYFVQLDLSDASLAGYYGSPIAPAGYAGVDPENETLNENDLVFAGDLADFHADRIYTTGVFGVAPGSDNPGVDAALYRPVALAGLAFFDEDGDALNAADPADPGLAGLAVQARHLGPDGAAGTADDLLFDGATTGADGAYSFGADQLIPSGQLRVEFLNPDPDSFAFVDPDAGEPPDSNDTTDSDVVGTADLAGGTFGFTAPTVRESGQSYASLDAGYAGTTTVGGIAFVDGDADGLSTGAADAPLSGVDVTLAYTFTLGTADLSLSSATTTAADTGAYTFTAVPSGSFSLSFAPPAAADPPFVPTFADEADNTDTDSDGDSPTDGLTGQELVGGAPERRDAGFYQYATAAGRVFFDTDSDALDSAATPEPGMRQVTVRLSNLGSDNAVGGAGAAADQTITATTGVDGTYAITPSAQLRPGNLTFEVENPSVANFAFVAQNAGDPPDSNDAVDSDVDPLFGRAAAPVGSGGALADLGAGLTGARSVAADAFVDGDGDGTNDDGTPLAGVTATLSLTVEVLPWLPSTALPERDGVTDATGVFTFSEVASGTFSLSFAPPDDTPPWQPTFPDVGDPSLVDSDGDSAVDGLLEQTLSPPADEARSQGYVKPAGVSGEVWFDSDGDGARDPGDAPMTGVTVDVVNLGPDGALGGTDDITDTVTTDATGAYSSTGALPPGQFVVRVVNPSATDFAFVPSATPENGSDVDAQGVSAPFSVASGAGASGVDAGLTGTASVGGRVFVDVDGDGQSVGEAGLADATVALTYTIGLPNLETTLTRTASSASPDGGYSFGGLPGTGTGSYTLTFTAPVTTPAWLETFTDVGPDATDSDGDQVGQSLDAAADPPAIDQGYFQPVRVTARVFEETTLPLNNRWDTGEPGLGGATVELQYEGPLPEGEPQRPAAETATSDGDGLASFDTDLALPPGQYRLVVTDRPPPPLAYAPTVGNTETIELEPLTSGGTSLTEGAPAGTTNVFGYVQPVGVAGEVWFDADDSGDRGPGDLPLAGFLVSAVGADGEVAGTDTSDALGAYGIAGLTPGTYAISVTNPSAADFTFIASATPDNGSDVDAQGQTQPFDITSGEPDPVRDVGVTGAKSVSGVVFLDSDGDGRNAPDPADPGLPGATVELTYTVSSGLDAYFGTAPTFTRSLSTTGAPDDGAYAFGGLPGGRIDTLAFTAPPPPPDLAPTFANVSENGFDDDDSDGPVIAGVDVDPTAASPVFDQGYFATVGVSGAVWFDKDNDDIRDADDSPLAGVTVEVIGLGPDGVLGSGDDITDTLTTDAAGAYSTDGTPALPPGQVVVRVTSPSTADFGFVLSGADSDLRSAEGTPPTAARTDPLVVASSGSAAGVDAGLNGARAISGLVFEDVNGDGLSVGDPGLAGATVALTHTVDLTAGGVTLSTTITRTATTGDDGVYSFAGLPGSGTGTFTVTFTAPDATPPWQATLQNAGADDAIDSDGDPATGEVTGSLTTPAVSFDQGYFRGATVSGRVWFDADGDGALDAGEPPLTGVTVELIEVGADGQLGGGDDGAPIVLTTDSATVTAGQYLTAAGGVRPGRYVARVTNPDTGSFAFLTSGADNDIRAIDGATPPAQGWTEPFDVTSGAESTGHDAGLAGAGAIQGLVFVDEGADGVNAPDPDDPPLPGATVALTLTVSLPSLDATLSYSATTGDAGIYSFAGLPAGTIASLEFAPPAATPPWQPSPADAGPGGSDGPSIAGVAFTPGATPAEFDQGYFQDAVISARVFDEQVTIDNALQTGEPGIPGVEVGIDTAPPDSATTGTTGVVTFTVRPGVYTVTSPTPPDFTASPTNTGSLVLTATSGLELFADFGYYRPSSLAGTAWFDTNRDGRLDAGEPGMEAITVTLVSDAGAPIPGAEGVTDAAGAYTIDDVAPSGIGGAPAAYRVCFSRTADFTFTQKSGLVGADGNSDANPDGCTDTFQVLGSGSTVTTADAGYLGLNSIGDLAWDDVDGDGIQGPAEDGIAGVVVTLAISTTDVINTNSPTLVMTSTASTASAGLGPNYLVTGVPPASGFRVVGVTPPPGYVPTLANVASATEETDSDAVGDSFGPVAGDVDVVDFGFSAVSAIGDLVWLDLNGNGVYDAASEAGAPGVVVRLIGATGEISRTTTGIGAEAGRYSFDDLAPGTYSLRFDAPAGYTFTNNGAGAIATDNDNDARSDGTTVPFTLAGGQQLLSVDAGLRGVSSIGGLVWIDLNRNNVRDPSETERVAGVEVTLTVTPTLTPGRPLNLSATTAENGTYSFANLPEGQARVSFTQPTGLFPVAQNVGPEATDSDGPIATVVLSPGSQVQNVDMGYRRQGFLVFMPLVHGPIDLAELSATFTVTPASPQAYSPAQVAVTVTNTGEAPASNFWVDLYINPSRTPEVNDRWNDICGTAATPCQGIAWFYTGTLEPGQSVTLVSTATSETNPAGYERGASIWPGYFVNGTSRLYVLVDSWNRDESGAIRAPDGAIPERDEGNNLVQREITVTPGTPPGPERAAPGAALLDRATLRR